MTTQPELRTLAHRAQLGEFLNARGLTNKGVEVGVLFGAFSTDILKTWLGHLYAIDPWVNQDPAVYHDGANREHDMNAVFAQVSNGIGRHPRCTLYRMMSLNAVGKFEDGELDFVYLDGNHALPAITADISAWWPKVRIGGIVSGHDFFTRYDSETNSDALTAVMELSEAIGVRPHVTWDSSWFFIKTEEADKEFRWKCEMGYLPRPVYSDNNVTPASRTSINVAGVVVVLPVARFDWNLARKWLRWVAILSKQYPPIQFSGIVAYASPELTPDECEQLIADGPAESRFRVVVASHVKEMGYFGTPNQMFRGALEYVEKEYSGCAMLWVEADAIPTRPSWLSDITKEYQACGRPFMGDIIREGAIPHLTGNAVYHPNWRTLAPSIAALGQEECGFDSLCAHDIVPRAHCAKTIQQVWRPPLPITAEWAKANIRPEAALFHQVKDGSLIDVLCDAAGVAQIPLAPALCESTYATQVRVQSGNWGPQGAVGPAIVEPVVKAVVVEPKVAILIVSYAKDMEFLRYCLKSIRQFASGFDSVTLLVPEHESSEYGWVKHSIKIRYFDEPAGKGMLAHEIQICRADEWCPDADFIVHLDADCMFFRRVTPAAYVKDFRALSVFEPYSKITNPNRFLWIEAVSKACGLKTDRDFMVMHPQVYPLAVYKATRDAIEAHTGQPFDNYVLSCRNEFPQSFAEHPTLHAIGRHLFACCFNYVEYDKAGDSELCGQAPNSFQALYRRDRDYLREMWSHGGIDAYKADCEAILAKRGATYYVK